MEQPSGTAPALPAAAPAFSAETIKAVHAGRGGVMAAGPAGTNRLLYPDDNPLSLVPFEEKVKLLAEIDAYARAKDPRVRQVSASLAVRRTAKGGRAVAAELAEVRATVSSGSAVPVAVPLLVSTRACRS